MRIYTNQTNGEEFMDCKEVDGVSVKMIEDQEGEQYLLIKYKEGERLVYLDDVAELFVQSELFSPPFK